VSRTSVLAVGLGQATWAGTKGIRAPDSGRFGRGLIQPGAGTQFCVTVILLAGSVYVTLE